MEDLIEEISKIDKQAFKREKQNETALNEEKAKYENEIMAYREEKLKLAHFRADMIYEKLTGEMNAETSEREAVSREKVKELKEQFSKNEERIIEEVFSALFSAGKRG